MADSKRVSDSGSGLGAVSEILNLFGSQSKQTSSADTGALQTLLGQLQGQQDPTKLLESIFQQASGQIPQLQAAFGNAVGARSGNNSSVQAALQKLLQQTTLAGQQQVMQQQQQNQNLQANVAGKIADSTRTVNSATSPNYGAAGKALAGLQILGRTGVTDKLKGLLGSGVGSGAAAAASPIFGSSFDFAPDWGAGTDIGSLTGGGGSFLESLGSGAVSQAVSSDDLFSTGADFLSGAGDWLSEAGGSIVDWFSDGFGLNNGGIVPQRFADGGVVSSLKSSGGRKSSAPTFQRDAVMRTAAINPETRSRGTPGFSGAGESSFGGAGGFDLSGATSGANAGRLTPSFSGSGGVTQVPGWLIGIISGALGLNPLVGLALKEANKAMQARDPTNPSSVNAINGSDAESDRNMERPFDSQIGRDSDDPFGLNGIGFDFDFGLASNPGGDLGDGVSGGFSGGYNPAGPGGGTEAFAGGGTVPGPNIDADVVPAMLTPGEGVLNTGAMDILGKNFLDELNRLGLQHQGKK